MTLKDLARELGVAPSTISRVLNGCSKNFTIPEELRKRILDHVEKRGYRANPVFQSMKLRKNKHVAVLFYSRTSMSTGFTVEQMVDKATLFLRDQGYEVHYTFCRVMPPLQNYTMPPWKVAGLLIPDVHNPETLAEIEKSGVPYVCMNGIAGPGGTSVLVDERAGICEILEHLHSLGHRRIAMLSPRYEQTHFYSIARERCEGFLENAHRMGIRPLTVYIHSRLFYQDSLLGADFDLHNGSAPFFIEGPDFTIELFRQNITAVICYDDFIMELFYKAHQCGIEIPGRLSVVAYNDLPFLKRTIPPTSSFRIPAGEMGELAARILVEKLQGNPDEERGKVHLLKGSLIRRESTAEPHGNPSFSEFQT